MSRYLKHCELTGAECLYGFVDGRCTADNWEHQCPEGKKNNLQRIKEERFQSMQKIVLDPQKLGCDKCEYRQAGYVSTNENISCVACELRALIDAGYGDLKDFVERLKSKKRDITYQKGRDKVFGSGVIVEDLDELLKELSE